MTRTSTTASIATPWTASICRSAMGSSSECAGSATTNCARRWWCSSDLLDPGLGLQLTHQRQHALAEVLDFFLEVQEAGQHQVHAYCLQGDDALGDLLRGANQVGLEAVVVLHQILKGRLGPVALAFR